MLRKLALLAVAVLLVAAPLRAGDETSKQMQAAMQEMMNCAVCKPMIPHMDKLGPAMTMEVITLNDGMAIMHNCTNPDLVPLFHSVGQEMAEVGAGVVNMSDDEAKKSLCSTCQGMRKLMKAGAKMHMGETSTGDIMAFTSDDPKVQVQITELETHARQMAAMMSGQSEG